jgi:predicted CoA-binding protein
MVHISVKSHTEIGPCRTVRGEKNAVVEIVPQVVAMVGESNDHYYSSYQVAQYLKEMGYKVYPVNPRIKEVDGERSYPSLADVPEPIDIVDVFRKPMYLDEIVDAAIAVGAKTLWAQLEVVSSEHERLQIRPRSMFTGMSNRSLSP